MEKSAIPDIFSMLTTSSPVHLPGCCSSLSVSLIERLASLLPPHPALTLSIGSGTGLLEALLLHHRPTLHLKAVEVPSTNNKYMPVDRMEIVSGCRDLCSLAADASAWMFIYPRDACLLRKYVKVFGGQQCRHIIWIGPKADELENEVFGPVWIKEDLRNCGLKNYETLALWRRTTREKADITDPKEGGILQKFL